MGFWSALGAGLEEYGASRLKGGHHGGLGSVLLNAAHPPNAPGSNAPAADLDRGIATAPGSQMQGGPDLSMSDQPDSELMGQGKMVTQPTLAMVGDKGPEAVVPLTDQPGAKVTPGMLGGMPRTRWNHPMGPNAANKMSPVRGMLPVKPNPSFR